MQLLVVLRGFVGFVCLSVCCSILFYAKSGKLRQGEMEGSWKSYVSRLEAIE